MKRFRTASVYVKTRKIAEIESGTYEHASGDEVQVGTEAVLGYSDGVDMVTLTFNTVVPVTGHELDLRRVILNKEDVQIAIIVDGGSEMWEGRMISRSYSFDSKTGAVKGAFSFQGGRPEIV